MTPAARRSGPTAGGHAHYASPGHLVRRASQLHTKIFDEEFEGVITSRQFAVVVALARNPGIDQISLANMIAIDRSTIGGMVSRLTDRGFIRSVRDPEDARRKVLELTPAGHRLLEELTPRIDSVSDRLLAPLSPNERSTFLKLLMKVATVDDPGFPGYREQVLTELKAAGTLRAVPPSRPAAG